MCPGQNQEYKQEPMIKDHQQPDQEQVQGTRTGTSTGTSMGKSNHIKFLWPKAA